MSRRIVPFLLVAVGCLAAALVGRYQFRTGAAGASVSAPFLPVATVATVTTRDAPVFIHAVGQAAPYQTVWLKSRVDGQIDRILFTEGQEVSAGQVLIQLDPRPYEAAASQVEGQLARDKAQCRQARRDLDRTTELLSKGIASRRSAEQQTSMVEQCLATIKTDEALADAAQLNLAFTTIRAPIAGRIGHRLVDTGNTIRASDGTALAQIVQARPITLWVSVPQDALAELRVRQKQGPIPVEALAADDATRIGTGHLVLIDNEIDPQTGTIKLKAEFENIDDGLWPGQLVSVRIQSRMRPDAISVPEAAIRLGPAGRFAYVLDAKDTVQMRPVVIGAADGNFAIVESGLRAGEIVVIAGQDRLAPGMVVRPAYDGAVANVDGRGDPGQLR